MSSAIAFFSSSSFSMRLGLVLGLPFLVGHAVDDLPRFRLGHGEAARLRRLAIPVGEAVAAEAGEVHEVDVLHVAPRPEVLDQAAKGRRLEGGAGGVVELGHGRVSFSGAGGSPTAMIPEIR